MKLNNSFAGKYSLNYMKRFLLSLLFLVPLLSSAQSNFQKGYVVTPSKEILHGYVDYKERGVNPKSFRFRSELKGETQVFTIQNSTAVVIDEMDAYRAFPVDITMSPVQISALSTGPDLSFRRDTVFLKVVQTGKNITLYAFKDNVKLRFYIQENDAAEPTELSRQLYLEDGNVMHSTDTYRRQVMAALRKFNPAKEYMLSKFLKYDETDLVAATALINDQDLVKSKYPSFRFFAGLGLSAAKTKYDGTHPLANAAVVSKTHYSPALTAGVDLFANPAIRKIIYRAELSVLMAKNEVSNTAIGQDYTVLGHSFDQFIVALSPQVIYNVYNKEKLKVFIGIGFGINYSKYSNNLYTTYSPFRNETEVEKDKIDLESLYISVPAAVGVTISKKIELSLSYSLPAGITNYNNYSVSTQRTRIGINYLFGK